MLNHLIPYFANGHMKENASLYTLTTISKKQYWISYQQKTYQLNSPKSTYPQGGDDFKVPE